MIRNKCNKIIAEVIATFFYFQIPLHSDCRIEGHRHVRYPEVSNLVQPKTKWLLTSDKSSTKC